MKHNASMILAVMVLAAAPAPGQLSGFVSATRGYHTNPLYNFEQIGDQLTQSYTELGYTETTPLSHLKVNYVSGLMIFNTFTDRNYYEHSISAFYGFTPGASAPAVSLSDGKDEEEDEGEEVERIYDGKAHRGLDVTLKIGARHDKAAFREFDNLGVEGAAAYRTEIGEMFLLKVSNAIGYRRYIYLSPLSNITDQLMAEFGPAPAGGFGFGLRTGAGLKHFTESIYDTARFETKRTFVLKPAGRGKPGAKIKVPSDKQLLLNAESENIVQLTAGLFGELKLAGGSMSAEFLYRRNPGLPTRYLAQYANTSILNEDIYNDHFSFEGPDFSVTARHALPLKLQGILTIGYQRKLFGAPALNLQGTEISGHRIDHRSFIEVYLSRYFEVTEGLGMDVAFSGTAMRNQSNDDYNDYSLIQTGLSIGVGF